MLHTAASIGVFLFSVIVIISGQTTTLTTTTSVDEWCIWEADQLNCEYDGCADNLVAQEGCIARGECACKTISGSWESGKSYGSCKCQDDMASLRIKYVGADMATRINVLSGKNNDDPVLTGCSFGRVFPDTSVICTPVIGETFDNKDTKIEIIHSDGSATCYAKIKSECKNNVNKVSTECEEIIITGWRDSTQTVGDTEFLQCTDGTQSCACCYVDCPSTTASPGGSWSDTPLGDCLCDILEPGETVYDDGYNGYGECQCDKEFGLMEMRLQYHADQPAKEIHVKVGGSSGADGGGDKVCSFYNVAVNDTFRCNVREFIIGNISTGGLPQYTKFDKNTYFEIKHEDDTDCYPAFHTSCSSDIVGTYSTECTEIFCTGWRDGNPAANMCHDGTMECVCTDPCAEHNTIELCKQQEMCCPHGNVCTTIETTPLFCDEDVNTTSVPDTGATTTGGGGGVNTGVTSGGGDTTTGGGGVNTGAATTGGGVTGVTSGQTQGGGGDTTPGGGGGGPTGQTEDTSGGGGPTGATQGATDGSTEGPTVPYTTEETTEATKKKGKSGVGGESNTSGMQTGEVVGLVIGLSLLGLCLLILAAWGCTKFVKRRRRMTELFGE